jgi:hypothetical protein
MKNLKKKVDLADDQILDDLISSCEKKMASKFKKKEEPKEEKAEKDDDSDDMDDETKSKLLEMYKKMKE